MSSTKLYLARFWTRFLFRISQPISLRSSVRFIQPIFLIIFKCIRAFIRVNGCDVCWSAATCMGDSLPRAWSISPNLTSSYPVFCMTKFCAEESSKQKDSKISRTDQKSSTEIGVKLRYLSPILHWFYPIKYMVSFWCANTLLEGDFKNTKTYQNMRVQQLVRPLLFSLEKFNQTDSWFTP